MKTYNQISEGSMTDEEWNKIYDIQDKQDRNIDLTEDEIQTYKNWFVDAYGENTYNRISNEHEGNTAMLNGKKFWIASVNNDDGIIEETHTYKTAIENDFHHSMYFSPSEIEKMDDGTSSIFWIDEDGGIEGNGWRNGIESQTINKIIDQIDFLSERKIKPTIIKKKPNKKVKKWKDWQKPFESKKQ